MKDHNIDIICIQEHRYTHSEDIKYYDTSNGWLLATASAWKISVNATIGGIGMLIGQRALKSLNSIDKIQPRMMVATFNGNPSATTICYSLTNVCEETDLIAFYNELSSLDMNAQIRKNVNHKLSLHNSSNRNGEHLTDFTQKNRLTCLNTKFQKRKGKLWTYTYANNAKSLKDYVFKNKKWNNSTLNCEVYSSLDGVSSDHRIVTAKIRLSLQRNAAQTTTTVHYDWSLFDNRDIRDKYALTLRNKFDALQEKSGTHTPNNEYENFVHDHLEAAAKCILTKQKAKLKVPWETLVVRAKRADVKTASKCNRRNPINTIALKLKKAKNESTNIYLKEQTEYKQTQINKIRDSVEDRQSRIAWQTVNEGCRRECTAKAKLESTSQEKPIQLWKQHFENLPGNLPKVTHEPITRIISKQLDINLGQFTQEELDSVHREVKNRKAAGLDAIAPEVWKTREFDDILL